MSAAASNTPITPYTFHLVDQSGLDASQYSLRVLGFSVASALFLQDDGKGGVAWLPSPSQVGFTAASVAAGATSIVIDGPFSSFDDILVGDAVSGTGIAAGTTVSGVSVTVTLNNALTAEVSGSATLGASVLVGGTATSGSTAITGLVPPPAVSNLRIGQAVSGSGIASGTTIASIGPNAQLALSANATGNASYSGTSPLSFSIGLTATGSSGATSVTLSGLASLALVTVGSLLSGTGIAANSVIAGIDSVTLTLSQATTAAGSDVALTFSQNQNGNLTSGSTTVSGLTSTASLGIGNPVNGDGIVPGTTITSIASATSIVLSVAPTATATGTTLTFPRASGVIPSFDISNQSSFVFDPTVQTAGLNGARIYLFVVPTGWPSTASQSGFAGYPTNPPGFPFVWSATGLGIQQPNTPPNVPDFTSSYPPFSIVEPTVDAYGAGGKLHIDVQTVDGFTFPLSLVLYDASGNTLGQVGQPVPANGVDRAGIIAAFQQTFAPGTAYGALLYGGASDIDGQYPGILNPGAYLANGANTDSPLATLWDTTLRTLYAGSDTRLNMIGDDGDNYVGLPITVNGCDVLQFTGYSDAAMKTTNGNQFNLYSPLTPDAANSGQGSGYQVFANTGVYADSSGDVLIQQNSSTSPTPSSVALGLQRDIVSALNRGIALSGPSGTQGRTAGDTSMFWGTEGNWYPHAISDQTAVQNQFSLFMHTATVGGALAFTSTASAPVSIENEMYLQGTATITTTTAHGLSVGEWVVVQGNGLVATNGTFPVASVPTPTTFTYTLPYEAPTPVSSGGGTVTAGAAATRLGALMGQAYGFAYDESPVHGPLGQPNVPSKFDPAPAGTAKVDIVFGPLSATSS
jgi:hypothetical protein